MKKIKNKKILVVSPTPSHPQNAGNRARIFQFLSNLKSLGFKIHFLYYNLESTSKHVTAPPDIKAMQAAWDRLYVAPNTNSIILKRIAKLIIVANSDRKLNSKFDIKYLGAKIGIALSKGFLGGITFLSSILVLIDPLIGHSARALYNKYPGFYIKLRKVILGNRQSLLNSTQLQADDQSINLNQESVVTSGNNVLEKNNYNIDDWYNTGLDNIVKQLLQVNNYGIVIIEYVFMSKALLNFPEDVFKVIDTHDLFTNRALKYKTKGLQDNFFSTSEGEEAKGFDRADLLIAIQDQERIVIEKMTYSPVATVGHKVNIHEPKRRKEGRNQILYLGAGNSSNIDGVNRFVKNILPLITTKIESVKLVLAGNICKHVLADHHIEKLGEVKNINNAYNEADIVINPGRVGTGLKIKNIECLGYGIPLVSTSSAAQGMESNHSGFVVVDKDDAFAEIIVKLLQDKGLYHEFSENAIKFAKKYNDEIDLRMKILFGL